jgi:hypothetical protein
MKYRKSKFSSKFMVLFLEHSDDAYIKLKPMFKKHGIAFKHDTNIFIDIDNLKKQGWSSKDHILFIEAHEIAHYILKHTKSSAHIEAEADYGGITLCKQHNMNKAAKLGLQQFEPRNKISFKKFDEKYGEFLKSKF